MRSNKIHSIFSVLVFALMISFSSVSLVSADTDQGDPAPKTSDQNKNKIFDGLDSTMSDKGEAGKTSVLIVFNRKLDDQFVAGMQNYLGTKEIKKLYQNLPITSAVLTSKQIKKLASLKEVKSIEQDELVTTSMSTASNYFGATSTRNDYGLTGDMDGNLGTYTKNDVVIAIVDTGIDFNHLDLNNGQVIGWRDVVADRLAPYDDNGHGTHVSGISAGQGDANSNNKGVAPGAALVGVKVLNKFGSGSTSQILEGLDWVITNKSTYGIEIVNMSLGSSGSSNGLDAMSLAINEVFDAGILPVVAAGNSGPRASTVGSPAAAANALAVCSMADPGENGFFLSSFSSRGPTADLRIKPDICAPGDQITAPKANTMSSYIIYSGTSMATPFVAGSSALLIDADPTITPSEIINELTATAEDWGVAGKDNEYGYGKMNIYGAVGSVSSSISSGTLSMPPLPSHYFMTEELSAPKLKDVWLLNVTSLDTIAVTAIYPDWSSSLKPNFDIYILNSAYTFKYKALLKTRQDTAFFKPTSHGIYYVVVVDVTGTGNYQLDISAGLETAPTLYMDDYTGGVPTSLMR